MLFEEQARSMHFAVRIRVVLAYVARLLLVVSVASLVPLVVMIAVGDLKPALYMTGSIVLMLLFALASKLTSVTDLQRNEALVISAGLFILPSLVFAVPMSAYGLAPASALFESVSGVTTTGLTVVADLGQRSIGLIFLRAWAQWLGGLGIAILFLGIIMEPSVATRQLGLSQDLSQDPSSGARAHAKLATLTYSVLTIAAIITLWISGLGFVDAILYAFTAVSTAGFTPTGESLGAVNNAATFGVFFFCVLGAMPFHAYYCSVEYNWRFFFRDLQVRAFLVAMTISVLLVLLLNHWPEQTGFWDRLSQAASLGVSAQTTSGFFNNLSPAGLSDSGKLALVPPMLIGGGLGSTGGGVKILRLLLILRVIELILIRVSVPNSARIEPKLGNHRVQAEELQAAVLILLSLMVTIGVSTLVFVYHGYDPVDALFDVTSAMATVGLSSGLVGPELPSGLKLLLCANMLLGRLETVAIIVLLFPWTWIGRRREAL